MNTQENITATTVGQQRVVKDKKMRKLILRDELQLLSVQIAKLKARQAKLKAALKNVR